MQQNSAVTLILQPELTSLGQEWELPALGFTSVFVGTVSLQCGFASALYTTSSMPRERSILCAVLRLCFPPQWMP